jgi:hypothetical protein
MIQMHTVPIPHDMPMPTFSPSYTVSMDASETVSQSWLHSAEADSTQPLCVSVSIAGVFEWSRLMKSPAITLTIGTPEATLLFVRALTGSPLSPFRHSICERQALLFKCIYITEFNYFKSLSLSATGNNDCATEVSPYSVNRE